MPEEDDADASVGDAAAAAREQSSAERRADGARRSAERIDRLRLVQMFTANVPHDRALGRQMVELTPEAVVFRLPYDPKLVGNPDTGTLHGGAITALLDGASGASVFAALTELVPIATLDLRIDYLRPAEPGRDVMARATCYQITRNVAFTRAVAYHDDPADPIAHSVGTFMLSTRAGGRS